MTRFERDVDELRERFGDRVLVKPLPSGAQLIELRSYHLVGGWNQTEVTILFVAPPAFPAGQPDCFWVEPRGFRLEGGQTPQNSNDATPIPEVGDRGTWFSWHVQDWNPNLHTLMSYLRIIEKRLNPPR